jgi:uncharacterized membrane protein
MIYIGGRNVEQQIILIISCIVAIIPLIIWLVFGKEKEQLVANYSHSMPNKIPPWQVDLLMTGKKRMSKNGLASIILELYTKKLLRIEKRRGKYYYLIQDIYDKKNISKKALELITELRTYDLDEEDGWIVCRIPHESDACIRFLKEFTSAGEVKTYQNNIRKKTGYELLLITEITTFLFYFIIGPITIPAYQASLINTIPALIYSAILPPTIFCRFKENYYKTYLEWHAFDLMLHDYAKIHEYLKEDHDKWQEWLVYATALGSTKNLMKGLKELHVISLLTHHEITLVEQNDIITAYDRPKEKHF